MRSLSVLALVVLLAGCAYVETPPHKPAILKAVGHGSVDEDMRRTPAQRRLLGIRAAKLDAYRNLAEQVHGLQVTGQTTVRDAVLRSDSYRTYVDTYLRGARVVTIHPIDEITYEVTVELDLTANFYGCLGSNSACGAPAPAPRTAGDCRDGNGCYTYPNVHYATP